MSESPPAYGSSSPSKPHWLCRLGLHRWTRPYYGDAIFEDAARRVATMPKHLRRIQNRLEVSRLIKKRRCTRPNCPRGEWQEV